MNLYITYVKQKELSLAKLTKLFKRFSLRDFPKIISKRTPEILIIIIDK